MSARSLPERRTIERRKAMIILEATDALELMKRTQYTGCFIGHMAEGVVKRIELPNPQGWQTT